MTFQFKTVIGIALIQAILLTVLIRFGLGWLHDSNEDQFVEGAATTIQLFTSMTKSALISNDLASLDDVTQEVLLSSGVVYARVRNPVGTVLAEYGPSEVLARPFSEDTDPSKVLDDVYDTFATVFIDKDVYGRVELGLSVIEFQGALEDARLGTVTIAMMEMLLVAILSVLLGTYLTTRLQKLKHGSELIAREGPGYKIPVRGKDEIAQAIASFNDMSVRLAESNSAQQTALNDSHELAEQLQISEGQKTAILEEALDAIITIDRNGLILHYNSSAERTFGFTREEAIGGLLEEMIVPHQHREAHSAGLERMRAHGETHVIGQRLELPGLHKDGNEFPMEIAITRIETEHDLYFTAFMRDISDKKRQEEEIQKALVQAEQANEAKSRFLGTMSHELRTPLNAIINMNQLLLDTGLSENHRIYARMAGEAGQNLATMVDTILEYSRIDSDEIESENIFFNLQDVIASVERILEPAALDKGLEFILNVDPDVPSQIRSDPSMLRQILLSLINNAIKFTQTGSVRIHVEIERESPQGFEIIFNVIDTGIGITQEKQAELFDEFTQADSSYSRRYGGVGLGLAICNKLAGILGGKIGCESEVEQGSRFWLCIPLQGDDVEMLPAVEPEPVLAPVVEITKAAEEGSQEHKPILLVDDSMANRLVAAAILKKAGYSIGEVENGLQAVEAVKHGDYGLVLMDISMPEMDGYQATQAIRSLEGARGDIAIVAMTAGGSEDDRQRCFDIGMNGYLGKPVVRDQLLSAVEKWLT